MARRHIQVITLSQLIADTAFYLQRVTAWSNVYRVEGYGFLTPFKRIKELDTLDEVPLADVNSEWLQVSTQEAVEEFQSTGRTILWVSIEDWKPEAAWLSDEEAAKSMTNFPDPWDRWELPDDLLAAV